MYRPGIIAELNIASCRLSDQKQYIQYIGSPHRLLGSYSARLVFFFFFLNHVITQVVSLCVCLSVSTCVHVPS